MCKIDFVGPEPCRKSMNVFHRKFDLLLTELEETYGDCVVLTEQLKLFEASTKVYKDRPNAMTRNSPPSATIPARTHNAIRNNKKLF